MGKESYLVLLTRFDESPESILGFRMCLKLAREGHHVYVTTTSAGPQLDVETQKAKQLTEIINGQVELQQPQFRWYETPSPEWIQQRHEQHFGFLSKLNVQGVIGTIPGTAQTAIQLKEKFKCKAILLATYKLKVLVGDVMKSVRAADEVWSVGPDIYTYYEYMFQEEQQIWHEQIMLLPDIDIGTKPEHHIKVKKVQAPKFVSVWNTPIHFIQNDSKEYSKGSDIEGYYTMSNVLSGINANKVSWVIHGLPTNDPKVRAVRKHANQNALKVITSSSIPSGDGFNWGDCFAFIVPDREEETLNYSALTAIYLGIPTLVSSQSNIGKFLLSLDCPEKFRAVVTMTGDPSHDAEEWKQKINKEILDKYADPREWASTMSEYLQSKRTFLESFLSDMIVNYEPSQWNDSSYKRPESTICPKHRGLTISLFCEQCQCELCSTCKEKWHASHITVLLREKTQEMRNNLSIFLGTCNKQIEEADCELEALEKKKLDVETSHQEAIGKMADQHDLIVQELEDSHQEQLQKINKLTDEQLSNFETRKLTLQEHSQKCKELQDTAGDLLEKSRMLNFITEANRILTSNQLSEIPATTHTTCKKLYYRQPYCKEVEDPVGFRNYVQERVLGYFDSGEEEGLPQEGTIDSQPNLNRSDSMQSFEGESMATHITSASIKMLQTKIPIIKQNLSPLELISSTNIKIFEGSHLNTFSSVLFSVNSLWICGWNKNWRGAKTTVLLNVDLPEYNLLSKEKKTDQNADLPTIMIPHGDQIIFTMRGGNEIFSFNTKTGTFRKAYSSSQLKVAAMCGGDYNFFLLNRKQLGYIQILDPRFVGEGKITTDLWNFKDCDMDMCLLKTSTPSPTIIVTTSYPHGSVRAVNKDQGDLWKIDGSREPLDATFSPCSVSSCLSGDTFVADQGKDKARTWQCHSFMLS